MADKPKITPARKAAIGRQRRLVNSLRAAQASVKGLADDAQKNLELLEGKDPKTDDEGGKQAAPEGDSP